MKRLFCTALLAVSMMLSAQASDTDAIQTARGEALTWLSLTDASQFGESWESAAALFQAAISKEDWIHTVGAVRSPIGSLKSRELASEKFSNSLPGVPDGDYVVFQFNASFENKASAVETVTAMKDPDGVWRVAGYFIK